MSEGQSVADLLLKIGVDAGEMISGFNGTARQARQMAKDMAEGINASLQKAFDPAAVNSGRMFENLETQYRATVSTMLRESIQARAIIERSVANINQSASESMIAGMTKVGGTKFDPMISMLNAAAKKQLEDSTRQAAEAAKEEADRRQDLINKYNQEQSAARELTAEKKRLAQETAYASAAIKQQMEAATPSAVMIRGMSSAGQMQDKFIAAMSESGRQAAAVQEALDKSEADRQQTALRRAEVAARLTQKLDADSQRIKEAGATAAVNRNKAEMQLTSQAAAATQEQIAAERRARAMLTEQQERNNEALKFSNRLRREAVAFMNELEAAGIDANDERFGPMVRAFREQQQMQRDEYKNRDAINKQKEDEARLDADALAVMRMTMTAQEAHNARIVRYGELLEKGKISQEKYNAAVKKSKEIMTSQDVGTGGMSGVIAQLSFGLEDFAQGIAMGDFRAAMLGASNNITMVVRGLKDMDSAARAAAFSVMKIPLAFAGFAAAAASALVIQYQIKNMNTELKSLSDRIAEATRQYFRFRQANEMTSRQERLAEELKKTTEIEDIEAKRRQAELDHADLIRRLDTERNENNVKGREAILKMLGGEANMIELQQYLLNQNTAESKSALESLSRAQRAALKGNTETVFQEMRALFNYLDAQSYKALGENLTPWNMVGGVNFFDMAALNELQKYFKQGTILNAFYGDSEEALKEIQTVLDQIAKDESKSLAERTAAEKALEDIKKRQLEIDAERVQREQFEAEHLKEKLEREHQIRKQRAEFEAESFRLMQQEQLFLINATESEREILRLKEQQAKVTRPGAFMTGFDPILNALIQQENAALQQQDQMAFLEAQKKAAENEIMMLQQHAIPKAQGALEQDAFQAQADAFKQMTENLTQKPNPQLTQVVNRLGAIEAAIKNGGVFLQVGP